MDISAPSINEVIKRGRWRRALFTSFTLSLTYFECYVLPQLRAQGCGAVDIYVDSLGYRDSLVEQRSRYAGRDYSIHPVSVKPGIFHPKLIYLWAEDGDEDVLMVGSGNLTYAGHGGNLEVFEILRPSHHSLAFAQAASFFADLINLGADRIDFGENSEPLRGVHRRMTGLAGKFPNREDVQFIHSLSESGLTQLLRELPSESIDELVVLSPYHHPEGKPLRVLAEAFQPKTLTIAINSNETSTGFPFDVAQKWGAVVRAVLADATHGRRTHAKLYQFRQDDRAAIFTGSFNATDESLATIRNVECGVLRRGVSALENWEEIDPPPFRPRPFPRSQSNVSWLVDATLSGTTLSGRLIANGASIPANWTFTLQAAGVPVIAAQDLSVKSDGSFTATLKQRIELDHENGIQIVMGSDIYNARGWVSLPQLLGIGAQRRALVTALAPIERGDDNAIGFTEFLYMLMQEIRHFTSTFHGISATSTSPAKNSSSDSRAMSIGGETVEPRPFVPDTQPGSRGSVADQLMDALTRGETGWALWGKMAQVLLGPTETENGIISEGSNARKPGRRPSHPIVRSRIEDDSEQAAQEDEKAALVAVLAQFDTFIDQFRSEFKSKIEHVRTPLEEREHLMVNLANLERLWLHVTLRAYVGVLADISTATFLVGEWIHHSTDIEFQGASKELMLFEYAGCAAILAYQHADTPNALADALMQSQASSASIPKSIRAVQYLEIAFGGAPDKDRTLALASSWLNSQIGYAFLDGNIDVAITALENILMRPTPRALVARYLREKPVAIDPTDWHPLPPQLLSLLKIAAHPKTTRRAYGAINTRSLVGCPVCYQDLRRISHGEDVKKPDPTLLAQLKLFCIAACPKCQAPLINRLALSE